MLSRSGTAAAARPSERVVGRVAVASEREAVHHLLGLWGTTPPSGARWRAAVVALADDEVIGVAVAQDRPNGTVATSAAVNPAWLGLGVGRFLGRLVGRELLRESDDTCEIVLAAPRPCEACGRDRDRAVAAP